MLGSWTSWEKWLWTELQGDKRHRRNSCGQISDTRLPFPSLKADWTPRVGAKYRRSSKRLMVTHWPMCEVSSGGVRVFVWSLQHQNSPSWILCVPPQAKTFPMNSVNLELTMETQGLPTPSLAASLPRLECSPGGTQSPTPAYVCFPSPCLLSLPLTLTKYFAIAKYLLPVQKPHLPKGDRW